MEHEILQRITINPAICHGKPTIRNKRYPVENMLELMASGMTNEEILADYDDLEQADSRLDQRIGKMKFNRRFTSVPERDPFNSVGRIPTLTKLEGPRP